ncbi:MAG TPA: hypothetical protein VE046_17760, partial [Steroidobacteraceae bacterium]|nr:hypothetical protein [Steroidobacteraceae bacterium]
MSIGQTDRTIFALVATLASILAAAACRADAILIINAKLHTVIDPQPIEQASVLIVDGRIREVGGRIAAPAGAQLIDAAGHDVTP